MINILESFEVMQGQELPIPTPLHLLIVEDVQADIELMAIALETAEIQFTYDSAQTASDCQRLLQTQTYNAILTDYRLPQFTAYQVLQLLQQSQQKIPLILVTGNLGEEAAVECIKAGMTDYVMKERLFRLPMVLKRSLQEFELKRQQQQAVARIQQQAQREAIVNQIVKAMHETVVLDQVLQVTADSLHSSLCLSRCLIFQPDSQGQMWIYHISQQTAERESFFGIKCLLHPYYEQQLAKGELVIINKIDRTIPLPVREIVEACQVRSLIIAPLLYQQSLLGGIILHQCDREREWTDNDLSLVKAICDHCAIAIHQAQLFSQIQRQAVQEQTLNQISRTLNSSLDPEYILQEIVRLTGEYFGVDRVIIYATEAEQAQVATQWRVSDRVVSILGVKMPLVEWHSVLKYRPDFLHQNGVFHAPDFTNISAPPEKLAVLRQMQNLSVLSVPIFIRERIFGGLSLHTTATCRTFTEEEIHLLQKIADRTAIALYNAQSYEHLEELVKQRTQELEKEKLLSEAANRAKSEFLSNISHELRTPLTGILGFSSVLSEQIFGTLNPKQKQYLESIHSCGKHLLELINDLLDFTKIEAGKEELNLEKLIVEEVGQDCLSLFEETCKQRGLELSVEIAPDVSSCAADRRRLKQILVNLLSNAVKFTESGSVKLKIEQTPTQIQFSVIDTGIGIALGDRERLFQPFQQLDGGLNRKYEGTGLGLALSRKLAQLHGGDISLQSELGCGSCFTLHIPR